jgi:hypothetical protein
LPPPPPSKKKSAKSKLFHLFTVRIPHRFFGAAIITVLQFLSFRISWLFRLSGRSDFSMVNALKNKLKRKTPGALHNVCP